MPHQRCTHLTQQWRTSQHSAAQTLSGRLASQKSPGCSQSALLGSWVTPCNARRAPLKGPAAASGASAAARLASPVGNRALSFYTAAICDLMCSVEQTNGNLSLSLTKITKSNHRDTKNDEQKTYFIKQNSCEGWSRSLECQMCCFMIGQIRAGCRVRLGICVCVMESNDIMA